MQFFHIENSQANGGNKSTTQKTVLEKRDTGLNSMAVSHIWSTEMEEIHKNVFMDEAWVWP